MGCLEGVFQIAIDGLIATIVGAALVIAGLVAQGDTSMTGVHHLKRGYDDLIPKLASLGGNSKMVE